MKLTELFESKWWDDTDVIRLFHGTSSALLDNIRTEGLRPPAKEMDEWALDVLENYVPRHEWTDELVKDVRQRCGRAQGGRGGESGQVIFCMTDLKGPTSYAQSLAQHGGEVAADVWETACMFEIAKTHNLDLVPHREYLQIEKPFQPRFADAEPVVIEILVPKDWCLFYNNLDRMKSGIASAREEKRKWAMGPIEAVYDDIFDNREVRVTRTVPPEMIVEIHEVSEPTV